MNRGDMRHAALLRCQNCSYQYYAPIATRCPKCRSEKLVTILEQELDYKRV